MEFILEFICTIAIWILMAVWCKTIARRNNRDTHVAFIIGLLLGIFGVVGYYIAGKDESHV